MRYLFGDEKPEKNKFKHRYQVSKIFVEKGLSLAFLKKNRTFSVMSEKSNTFAFELSWASQSKLTNSPLTTSSKTVKSENSSRQKWRMDILEVTIIFSFFLPTRLLPQLLFLPMWKPIPKLCHQTRLAKLSQWLIIYGVQFGKWQKVRYETVFNNSIFLVYCHVTKCHQSCRYSHTFCLCRNLRPFWSMGVSRWKCD